MQLLTSAAATATGLTLTTRSALGAEHTVTLSRRAAGQLATILTQISFEAGEGLTIRVNDTPGVITVGRRDDGWLHLTAGDWSLTFDDDREMTVESLLDLGSLGQVIAQDHLAFLVGLIRGKQVPAWAVQPFDQILVDGAAFTVAFTETVEGDVHLGVVCGPTVFRSVHGHRNLIRLA